MEELNTIFIESFQFKFKYIFENIFKFILYENDPLIINIRNLKKNNYTEILNNFKNKLLEELRNKEYNDKLYYLETTVSLFKEPKNFIIDMNNIPLQEIDNSIAQYFLAKINDEIENYIIFNKNNKKFSHILTRTCDVFFRDNFTKKIDSIIYNFFKKVVLFLSKNFIDNYDMKIIDIQKIKDRFCFSIIYNTTTFFKNYESMPLNLKNRIHLLYNKNEYDDYLKLYPNEILSLIKEGSLVPKINFNEKITIFENTIFKGDELFLKFQELFEINKNVDKEVFKKFTKIYEDSKNKDICIEQLKSSTEKNSQLSDKNQIFIKLINRVLYDSEKINLSDMNTYFFIMELVNGLVEINSPNKNIYLYAGENKNIKYDDKSKDIDKNNINNINNS